MDDGSLGVFSAQRQEKLAGWTIWETDGTYISNSRYYSFLYIVVKRTVNGATKYYLEQISNSQFAIPTDCSVSKIFSGFISTTRSSILVNGTLTSTKQLVIDGFTNAPTTGEKFKIGGASTEYNTKCK